mgnify:CR=1 FL=1
MTLKDKKKIFKSNKLNYKKYIFAIIILNAIINAIGEILVIGLVFTTPLTYIVVCKYYFQRLNILSSQHH